jgi:hypothetical protein
MARAPRQSRRDSQTWAIDDEVTSLRRKDAAGPSLPLPQTGRSTLTIDSAIVRRDDTGWWIEPSRAGRELYRDGVALSGCRLIPGLEIGVRSGALIAESPRLRDLTRLLGQLVGLHAWPAIDHALRVVRDSVCGRRMLVLSGDTTDVLVASARRLHRLAVDRGDFVICTRDGSGPGRLASARAALTLAAGGTVCFVDPLPGDLSQMLEQWHASSRRTQLIRCAPELRARERCMIDPITIAPLRDRPRDRRAIIDHYVAAAIGRFGASPDLLRPSDRSLLSLNDTLDMIEAAATRIVAVRHFGGVSRAAAHLGISHAAMVRYFARRRIAFEKGTTLRRSSAVYSSR